MRSPIIPALLLLTAAAAVRFEHRNGRRLTRMGD